MEPNALYSIVTVLSLSLSLPLSFSFSVSDLCASRCTL